MCTDSILIPEKGVWECPHFALVQFICSHNFPDNKRCTDQLKQVEMAASQHVSSEEQCENISSTPTIVSSDRELLNKFQIVSCFFRWLAEQVSDQKMQKPHRLFLQSSYSFWFCSLIDVLLTWASRYSAYHFCSLHAKNWMTNPSILLRWTAHWTVCLGSIVVPKRSGLQIHKQLS